MKISEVRKSLLVGLVLSGVLVIGMSCAMINSGLKYHKAKVEVEDYKEKVRSSPNSDMITSPEEVYNAIVKMKGIKNIESIIKTDDSASARTLGNLSLSEIRDINEDCVVELTIACSNVSTVLDYLVSSRLSYEYISLNNESLLTFRIYVNGGDN